MRFTDIIKTSQSNLMRAKLRTLLTIIAVFMGALTLSLTNGVGNGVKDYVNTQLGNIGAENTLVVQAKQTEQNPVSTEVREYDPEKETNEFFMVLVDESDIEAIRNIEGIERVVPDYAVQIEYITLNEKKYEALASQHVEGFNLEMAAGRTVELDSANEITIPARYVTEGTAEDIVGKEIALGIKNAMGDVVEIDVVVTGVQQQSLLGNSGIIISEELARTIYEMQTEGIPGFEPQFMAAIAQFNPDASKEDIDAIKQRLEDAGYVGRTIQDQVGTIVSVINTILIVLNIFAVITLLVAGFGIINTLMMSINERTSEIGLMKALGANRKMIFSIFAVEAASIGFWGALLGVGLSIIVGMIVNQVATQTFLKDFAGFDLLAFPLIPSLTVLFGIMFLAFLAGTLPALKASKLDPIKALRHE